MIQKISRARTIGLITLVSIIISILITIFIMETFGSGIDAITLSISIIAPAIIAPSVTWYIVCLLVKIHQLEKEQRTLATYDMLTGLLVRRAFLSKSEALFQLAKRNNSLLSLAYIDIDNFKKINDKYGHAGGDAVLESFGVNLRKSMRKSDLLGRIGGEEFAIVLPDTNMKGAIHALEKIRLLIKKRTVDVSNQNIQYTVSIGVTIFDKNNQVDLEQLIMQSDNALYNAKNSGKDCIVEYKFGKVVNIQEFDLQTQS